MTQGILVFIEERQGTVKKSSLEALCARAVSRIP